MKLAQWPLRRRFSKVASVFLIYCNDLPLQKSVTPLSNPSSQWFFPIFNAFWEQTLLYDRLYAVIIFKKSFLKQSFHFLMTSFKQQLHCRAKKSPRKSPIIVYLMVSVYLLWNVFSDQSKWKSARKVLYEFVYTVYYTVYYIYTIPNTLFMTTWSMVYFHYT